MRAHLILHLRAAFSYLTKDNFCNCIRLQHMGSNLNALVLLTVIMLAIPAVTEAVMIADDVTQVNLGHALIKSLSRCCVSERYPEGSRVSRVNRQFTVLAFVLCISVLAVRTVSVLFRLSVSRQAKDVPGYTQLRGCHGGTSVATVPIEETITAVPGLQRGSSSPLHQASPPTVDDAQGYSLRASYYSIAYFFGRFIVAVRAEFSWPSAGFSPYGRIPRTAGRNRLLRSFYGRRPTLFLIVIATDEAVRDLWVLDHALRALNSESIRFTGLGGWVTLDDIKTEIKKIYEESKGFPGSQVVILLTGHGSECNKMILPMSKFVDSTYLFEVLFDSHNASPATPVTILFDICRPGGDPSPEPPKGISLVWTCLPGEASGAYRLPHGPDSCFLTALMMASRQLSLGHTRAPQDIVQMQLNHVTEYLKKLYSMRHSQGGCQWCASGWFCCEPMPQNNTDGLLMLMETLSGTEVADGVYQWFRSNHVFCIANNLPVPRGFWERLWNQFWRIGQADAEGNPGSSVEGTTAAGSDVRFDPLPEDNTSRRERGANRSVNAGQTPRRIATSSLVGW
ncbi:hypothetical protein FRC11_010982 [Ceratobasidium sp. 423]|nr:hypothetical protein FRC11_010982 [Ceratobasidium sp. 423]